MTTWHKQKMHLFWYSWNVDIMILIIRCARLQTNSSTWSDRCATGYFTKLVVMTPLLHDYTVYDKFMTVSCHSYDGDMSLLWRYIQMKCHQTFSLWKPLWTLISRIGSEQRWDALLAFWSFFTVHKSLNMLNFGQWSQGSPARRLIQRV